MFRSGTLRLPLGLSRLLAAEVPIAAAPRAGGKCCIYCGSGLHASPRSLQVRCPACGQYVKVDDITLRGEVQCARTVTAGTIHVLQAARVAGDLVAGRVEISGRVLGNVIASGECVVTATGKVAGAILCRSLRVDEGAEVVGTIERVAD